MLNFKEKFVSNDLKILNVDDRVVFYYVWLFEIKNILLVRYCLKLDWLGLGILMCIFYF